MQQRSFLNRRLRRRLFVVTLSFLSCAAATAQQAQPMTPEKGGRPITRVPRSEPQPPAPQPAVVRPDDRNRDDGSAVQPRIVPPHEREDWVLGIETETLDVGERVRNVKRNSPAARAGLEPGDIIIAVGGYQVGRVDGRTYPIEDEVRRRVSRDGRARLLVQNTRNAKLQNVDVQLDRHGNRDGGGRWDGGQPLEPGKDQLIVEASFRDRREWPRNAEVRARIVRPGLLSRDTVAEQTYRNLQGSPLRFEMWYPTQQLKPGTELELRVEVWDGNQRWLVSDPRVRFNVGQTQPVQIELRRA